MTYVVAIVNKKNLLNRTVPSENELVPLNGRVHYIYCLYIYSILLVIFLLRCINKMVYCD